MTFCPNGSTTFLSLSNSSSAVSFSQKENGAIRIFDNANQSYLSFYGTATVNDIPIQYDSSNGLPSEVFRIPVDATTISIFCPGAANIWVTVGQDI